MYLVELALTAFVVGLSGALLPGPLLAATVSESARRGGWTGSMVVAGHGLLELGVVVAVCFGLGGLLSNARFTGPVSLAGGGVMLWMGLGMLRSVPRLSLQAALAAPGRGGLHPVAAGVVLSLFNPGWIVWWATIGLGYLVSGFRFGWIGVAVFFTGHILSDLAWYSAVSTAVAHGRRLLSNRMYQGLIAACALAMLIFGIRFAAAGAGWIAS